MSLAARRRHRPRAQPPPEPGIVGLNRMFAFDGFHSSLWRDPTDVHKDRIGWDEVAECPWTFARLLFATAPWNVELLTFFLSG